MKIKEIFTKKGILKILSRLKKYKNLHTQDNNMSAQSCLLLTSAIQVHRKGLVERDNTSQRLDDYKQILKMWLTKQTSLDKIVFVDNSGYSLVEIKKIVEKHNKYNKQVEILSFKLNAPNNLDKSHFELKTIQYALKNSKLINKSKYFVEVSGRGYVKNIDKIIKNLPSSYHIIGVINANMSYVETNINLFNVEFYTNHIFDHALKISSDITNKDYLYLERQYIRPMLLAIEKDYKWYPFAYEPQIFGIGGTQNKSYGRGWMFSFKRSLLQRLVNNMKRTSHGRNRLHLMDEWNKIPK